MKLYVMRHGPAQDLSASGRDCDRELTDDGRDVVRRTAEALRSLLVPAQPPARIFSSPYARAVQTAEIVAGSVGVAWETRDELGAENPPPMQLASECGRGEASVVLISHMPMVQTLVQFLSGSRGPGSTAAGFRTAMIVCLERVDEGWRLVSIFDPHEL